MNKYDQDMNAKIQIALGNPTFYVYFNYVFMIFMSIVIIGTVYIVDNPAEDVETELSAEDIAANVA